MRMEEDAMPSDAGHQAVHVLLLAVVLLESAQQRDVPIELNHFNVLNNVVLEWMMTMTGMMMRTGTMMTRMTNAEG